MNLIEQYRVLKSGISYNSGLAFARGTPQQFFNLLGKINATISNTPKFRDVLSISLPCVYRDSFFVFPQHQKLA